MLKDDPEYAANLELARRVVLNQPAEVNFYLGPYNQGLLNKINFSRGCDSYTDLFFFLADPFDEATGTPKWKKVSLYKAINCSLQTYTSTIAWRHFTKIINKERDSGKKTTELLEFCDYESLIKCDRPEEESDNLDQRLMKEAFQSLKDRDQKVLQYLVIEKKTGVEAYELLKDYINPEPKNNLTSDEIKENWSLKQKQDAVSLMKGRALKKLQKKYKELKYENR